MRGEAVLRQTALRLAFGVTGTFAIAEALDWDFTFIGPMLAAQLLVNMPRPPSLAQGIGLVLTIAAATGIVLVLATALLGAPVVLMLALGLLLYLTFYAQFRGAPEFVTLMLQIAAVTIPVFAVVSPEVAAGLATTLIQASLVALGTIWAAFAIFPAPQHPSTMPPAGAAALEPAEAARAALRNTLVIMPILTWYVLDATQVAVVVLITMVTLLRQIDPRQGARVAAGLIVGNLAGGLAAAIAYNILLVSNSLLSFVLVCLVASLLFAGRIVAGGHYAPILAVGFATFILLLGLGLSPMPGGSGEAFLGRLLNVLAAAGYTVGALAILHNRRPKEQ